MKMRALDLFCGGGGVSRGLADAGFEVMGVDIEPQKNYPFEFMQEDVTRLSAKFLAGFDFIWASPPCQRHSVMTNGRWKDRVAGHADLIEPVRAMLKASGKPYVIENVVGAPVRTSVMLCGSMFDLRTKQGSQLRRHRLFECSFPVEQPKCNHNKGSVIGVYGGGQHPQRRSIPDGIGKMTYADTKCFTTQDRRDAMGIQWMSGKELSQAIPPAYSKYIAEQFFMKLENVKAG
jgi:DNA (cytosine-5)-methyltransferase 1